ncbi:hypothetical protein ACFP1Z_01115 [Streptomyces gamaensis]|uniref:Uncharacterized protein n=1 Tax=Streptomyces gamaensis TaxID=1763542 RepID=A0ABW0YTG9_9ACTN
MISFKASNKMTDRPVVAAFPFGSSIAPFQGTGLSGIALINERATKAPAAAAAVVAPASAYAPVTTANGAGFRNEQLQHQTMWAFRGLEPWRDPA